MCNKSPGSLDAQVMLAVFRPAVGPILPGPPKHISHKSNAVGTLDPQVIVSRTHLHGHQIPGCSSP